MRRYSDGPPESPASDAPQRGSATPRTLAWVFISVVLFACGATLGGAFGASADEGVPDALMSETAATDETTSGSTPTDTVAGDETSTSPAPALETTTAEESAPPPTTAPAPDPEEPSSEPSAPPPSAGSTTESTQHPHYSPAADPSVLPHSHSHRPPETTEGGAATIWLHRVLPDPTPPARRLSPEFAELLRATARAYDVHWRLLLAVLRAHGRNGRVPASAAKVESVAARLALDDVRLGPRILSLARYNRAVGLRALVKGFEAAKPSLEERILGDERVSIYAAGRADIAAGRVNVRVLVAIRYLVVTFHQVTVSSLVTGHRLFARPGVVSAHVYGMAVDVSSLKGIPITGNQGLDGITERAVEALLRLPAEVQPQQIISLLGLGGPSFPQADHYDHIHVGF